MADHYREMLTVNMKGLEGREACGVSSYRD